MDDRNRRTDSAIEIPFFVHCCIAEGKWKFNQDESLFFCDSLEINFIASSRRFEIFSPPYNIRVVVGQEEARAFLTLFSGSCVVQGYDFYPHILFLIDVFSC